MISRFRVMGMLSGILAAVGVAPTVAVSADALDHPALVPTHDVVVTYRFQSGLNTSSPKKKVHVSFQANGNRLRIDPVNVPGITILDRPAQRVTLISMEKKSYVQFMPMNGLKNPFMLDLNMTYHPGDISKIAGYECRNWDIETSKGKAKACVTADGIILSEEGVDSDGVSGRMEALNVSYRDLPLTTFEPPVGFHKFEPRGPAPQARQGQPVPKANVNPDPKGMVRKLPGDTTQPSISNDSVTDGSTMHADQPSGGHAQ